MKKFIIVLCTLFCGVAHAGPIANIEYIHALIKQRHGIDIEYSPELKSEKLAANMKYLLTLVDIANTRLNHARFTHYGENDAYATLNAADTDTVITAVDELIKQIEFPFSFTPATESNEYMFTISAAGNFYIDWGDGIGQIIKKTKIGAQQITHTYENAANTYTIRLGGRATDYVLPGINVSVITFSSVTNINGCLGCVFSTIGDGTTAIKQPTFANLFYGNGKVTGQIPENLFNGIYGQPVKHMFRATFYACGFSGPIPEKLFAGIRGTPTQYVFERLFQSTGITEIPENLFAGIQGAPATAMFQNTFYNTMISSIPGNLFAGIKGAPAASMFQSTFSGCSGLTGEIPENLFAGISGAPAESMFRGTFEGCSGLSGSIPENLFAGIRGAPASSMFNSTFSGCSGLTGEIPGNLFAGIRGAPAASMFASTFQNSKNLTGPIPGNLFAGISGAPAASMFRGTFGDCSGLTGSIPENLFAGIQGAPASSMFANTFTGCLGLTGEIPENLFAGISGAPVQNMFDSTFCNCINLGGEIPGNLFAGISGAPAQGMFNGTFRGTAGFSGMYTSIGENLFAGIDDTAESAPGMFNQTFGYNSQITGSSVRINGKYLYDIWPEYQISTVKPNDADSVSATYRGCENLSDYADIPEFWK